MWLLKPEVLREIRVASTRTAPATAEQQAQFVAARAQAVSAGDSEILTVAGDTAEIRVLGVLTAQPSFLMWLLGIDNTTYSDIQNALTSVANDPTITRVSMFVDSPGGQVDGLFDTLDALEGFSKPINVTASCACSAAYAIAAAAGPITAKNIASEFGSVGVAVSIYVEDDVVDITSTEAPNKRPDVTTDEGKAVVVEQLDAIHELFAEAIARGRNTSVSNVNSEYGRGSTLLAYAARSRGMIDGIAGRGARAQSSAAAETDPKVGPLTAEALKFCERAIGPQTAAAVALCESAAPSTQLLDLARRLA